MPQNYPPYFFKIGLLAVALLVQSCSSIATNPSETGNLSTQKKYLRNIRANMLYPDQLLEVERDNNYSYSNAVEDVFYLVSVYVNQSGEQVQQIINDQIASSKMPLTITNDFKKQINGLIEANINANTVNGSFPGYLIIYQLPNGNSYLLYTVASIKNNLQKQIIDLQQMALSIEPIAGQTSQATSEVPTNSQINSAQEYQQLLYDKVLVFSNHSKSTISGEDNTASHGVVTYYEDVEKIKRFVLCGGGFSYFRFISKGDQITGDNGTFVLDKFSGHWKVISENNQSYIYIQDERDNRYRTWKIDGIKNNFISIEGNVYTIFKQEEGENECTKNGLVVPD